MVYQVWLIGDTVCDVLIAGTMLLLVSILDYKYKVIVSLRMPKLVSQIAERRDKPRNADFGKACAPNCGNQHAYRYLQCCKTVVCQES